MNSSALSTLDDVPSAREVARPDLGLPVLAVVGLVLLTVPRAVAHDLHLVPPSSLATTLLAVVPLVVWVVVAAGWSRRPLVSMLATGVGYGTVLALVHNLSWGFTFDEAPRLGGNLTGLFSPLTEEVLMRGATTIASLATGVVTGLVCGLIALAIVSVRRRGSR